MKVFKIQPSSFTDNISDDGHEQTSLPYPFFVNEDGSIRNQEFWRGSVARVVGFQNDLNVQVIDLWWSQAARNPQAMVNMYLVTADDKNNLASHRTAIMSVEVMEV